MNNFSPPSNHPENPNLHPPATPYPDYLFPRSYLPPDPPSPSQQHQFNTVGSYKYPKSDPASHPPSAWPPGFVIAFVLCVSILLWVWVIGAYLWARQHFGAF